MNKELIHKLKTPHEKKRDRWFMGIVIFSFLLACGVIYAYSNESIWNKIIGSSEKEPVNAQLASVEEISTEEPEKCESNWTFYSNNTLGVKFCYPSSWGEAKTAPVEYLTKLEGAVDVYSQDEHNGYSNRIQITFSKSKNVLSAFNEKYKGEYYPNGQVYDRGYMDNIPEVKNSGTACDYQVGFEWDNKAYIHQILEECTQDLLVSMTEHMERFDKNLYSYEINGLGYKKLQNGYFDNLFLSSRFGHLTQVDAKLTSMDDVFKAMATNQQKADPATSAEQLIKDKAELISFFKNISSFKPTEKKKLTFKRIEGENSNITSIRKFYWYLDSSNYANAYKLYGDKSISLEKFTEQYKNIYAVSARDIELKDNSYDYYLDYQIHNTKPTVYHNVATVTNGLITITSSEEIITKVATFGNLKAYGKRIGSTVYMVLKEDETEKILDQGEAEYNELSTNIARVKFFNEPSFDSTGTFLRYNVGGWEWSNTHIYNTKTGKQIIESPTPSSDSWGFVDTTHYFTCIGPGMQDGTGKVFSLPEGKELYSVYSSKSNESYMDLKCSYNKDQQSINFNLSQPGIESLAKTKTITFDLATNKVK